MEVEASLGYTEILSQNESQSDLRRVLNVWDIKKIGLVFTYSILNEMIIGYWEFVFIQPDCNKKKKPKNRAI